MSAVVWSRCPMCGERRLQGRGDEWLHPDDYMVYRLPYCWKEELSKRPTAPPKEQR